MNLSCLLGEAGVPQVRAVCLGNNAMAARRGLVGVRPGGQPRTLSHSSGLTGTPVWAGRWA